MAFNLFNAHYFLQTLIRIFIFFFNPFQSTLSRHFWGLGVVVVVVVVVVVAATRPVVVEVSLHAGQFAMDVKIAAGLS